MFKAEPTNVSVGDLRRTNQLWVVRDREMLKGLGRLERFSGTKAECEAVARVLNALHRKS